MIHEAIEAAGAVWEHLNGLDVPEVKAAYWASVFDLVGAYFPPGDPDRPITP